MSTDGIQPFNNTDKTIWPVTLVINEVEHKKRFLYQNLILAGIWPGPSKPKRFEMSAFLEIIVQQLKELEEGFTYECRSIAGYKNKFLKVFLICASMVSLLRHSCKICQNLQHNLDVVDVRYKVNVCAYVILYDFK